MTRLTKSDLLGGSLYSVANSAKSNYVPILQQNNARLRYNKRNDKGGYKHREPFAPLPVNAIGGVSWETNTALELQNIVHPDGVRKIATQAEQQLNQGYQQQMMRNKINYLQSLARGGDKDALEQAENLSRQFFAQEYHQKQQEEQNQLLQNQINEIQGMQNEARALQGINKNIVVSQAGHAAQAEKERQAIIAELQALRQQAAVQGAAGQAVARDLGAEQIKEIRRAAAPERKPPIGVQVESEEEKAMYKALGKNIESIVSVRAEPEVLSELVKIDKGNPDDRKENVSLLFTNYFGIDPDVALSVANKKLKDNMSTSQMYNTLMKNLSSQIKQKEIKSPESGEAPSKAKRPIKQLGKSGEKPQPQPESEQKDELVRLEGLVTSEKLNASLNDVEADLQKWRDRNVSSLGTNQIVRNTFFEQVARVVAKEQDLSENAIIDISRTLSELTNMKVIAYSTIKSAIEDAIQRQPSSGGTSPSSARTSPTEMSMSTI